MADKQKQQETGTGRATAPLLNAVDTADIVEIADVPAADAKAQPETEHQSESSHSIVADEAEAIEAHDIESEHGSPTVASSERPVTRHPLRRFFAGWWHNRVARYGTILLVLATLGALATMPTSRYYAMNTVGIRSAASLTILDNTTQQPLKNVSVELGARQVKTNQDGVVKLSKLPLGTQSLTITQTGFSTITRTVTLGLGSNPLGEFAMDAVGLQFRFKLVDYLSGQPVKNGEISSGESNAQADGRGQLVLTVGQDSSGRGDATISADGYRSENLQLDIGQKQSRSVALVPKQKELFVSKQSGAYDVYKSDIDGKNRHVLLAASGLEDASMTVVAAPDGDEAAVVSRRDNTKNQDGYPLQALTMVDVDSGTSLNLDHSERIQIVDWIGDDLVYVKVKAGTSAGNPERYQLISYNYQTTARIMLASANNFNDVVSAQGSVYYAASNNYQDGDSQLVRIEPDNTGKQVLLDKTDVWNISRTGYNTFGLSILQGSYSYQIGDSVPKKTSNTSTSSAAETRFYLDAADGKRALWTDSRDGKGVLLAYDPASGKDTTLVTQGGLSYPIRWLNARTAIYRVATPAETADYAVSLDGGKPKKIVDLTNVAGLGKWNY